MIAVSVAGVAVFVGASFAAVTAMLAVSVVAENALVPPTVPIATYVPAAPPVLSQAPKLTLAVPFQLAVGTKRRLSVASSSNPLPALAVKSSAAHAPAPTLYCQVPWALSTAVTYTASTAVVSTSVIEASTTIAAIVVPVLAPSVTSSIIAVRDGLCAASSTGASLTAVTLWLSTTLSALYAVVPPAELTSSVAPAVTVADESISVTVKEGAAPFQLLAGTNFSWSVLFNVRAVDAPLIVLIVVQLVPLLEYCQEPLAASAV